MVFFRYDHRLNILHEYVQGLSKYCPLVWKSPGEEGIMQASYSQSWRHAWIRFVMKKVKGLLLVE